jgi:hypothetical protein
VTTKPPAPPAKAGPKAGAKKAGKPFVKGTSGNPIGMKPGTKHRKTLLLAAMTAGDRAAIVGKIIRQAKRGCRVSQKLVVDRVEPPRRGSPVRFPLPPVKTTADVVNALAAVAAAIAAGQLSPTEAVEVAGVVELQRKAIEQQVMEAQMAKFEAELEARFPKK